MIGIFGRKKEKKEKETARKPTPLEEMCADDKETYEALFSIMFLDPRKIGTPMKEAAENAQKSEKEQNPAAARMWYEVAGGLAIYDGNVKKAVEYYGKAEKVAGQPYLILKNPEKAVAKAQEYYKKFLT